MKLFTKRMLVAVIVATVGVVAKWDNVVMAQSSQSVTIESVDSIVESKIGQALKNKATDLSLEFVEKLEHDEQKIEAIIAIIVILLPFITPIVIVFSIFYFGYKSKLSRNRLMETAIKNNQEIPKEFFMEKTPKPKSRLQSSIVAFGWGMGIFLFFMTKPDFLSLSVLSVIPFMIGVAKLITYFVEDRPKLKAEKRAACQDADAPAVCPTESVDKDRDAE